MTALSTIRRRLGKRNRPIRMWFLDFEHIGLARGFSGEWNLGGIILNRRSPVIY